MELKKLMLKEKKFDPNFHQAMTELEDDSSENGTIVQEIQPGYMLRERLLRPALVGVAKKKIQKMRKKVKKKRKNNLVEGKKHPYKIYEKG